MNKNLTIQFRNLALAGLLLAGLLGVVERATGCGYPPTVWIEAIDPDASETGPNTGTFRVWRSDTSEWLRVYYTTNYDSAILHADYELNPFMWYRYPPDYSVYCYFVYIPPGQQYVDITLTPIPDTNCGEGTEYVTLTLIQGPGFPNYWIGGPDSATVTIYDKDLPVANCQTVVTPMTAPVTPVDIILSGSGSCPLTFDVGNLWSGNGSLGPVTQIDDTHAQVTFTPNAGFEGYDGFSFTVNGCGCASDPAYVNLHVLSPPNLLPVECQNGRITLEWTLSEAMWINHELHGFKIYRCESPCTPTEANLYDTIDYSIHTIEQRTYVDRYIEAGKTYCYRVKFLHKYWECGDYNTTYESPFSNTQCGQSCPPAPPPYPYSNGLDVAFIVDNTLSMEPDWEDEPLRGDWLELVYGIDGVLDYIEDATGKNYRLALVTPDGPIPPTGFPPTLVHVRVNFSNNNRNDFKAALKSIFDNREFYGSTNCPESTDECLNTVLNHLSAAGRQNPRTCTYPPICPLQIGDFTGEFRENSTNLVVLITDSEPGGFCDEGDNGYQAAIYAQQAANMGVKINGVEVFVHECIPPINMCDIYCPTTGGWYTRVHHWLGVTIIEAVSRMLTDENYGVCP